MPEGITDPNYRPAPGRLGNLTVMQLHTLEKLKKELKEEGAFVEERMNDAMLLRCAHLSCPFIFAWIAWDRSSDFLRFLLFPASSDNGIVQDRHFTLRWAVSALAACRVLQS